MNHRLYRVTAFHLLDPTTLRVSFDDGTAQTIDFSPVLAGEFFGALRDPALFARVSIDPVAHTLVWPNGADFDPETLHEWPRCVDALRARAQTWEGGKGV